jgi:thiamine-phosphate pyrophosphorylase
MKDFGLYIIITDPVLPYNKIAEICVEEEIRYLQLREKHMSATDMINVSREIMSIVSESSTKFIINDRPDVAMAIGADGVHLGQDDIPVEYAREILKKSSLFGLSTHNFDQAREALKKKPDYIGFGPIYKTPTKQIPDPVVGTERLQKVLEFSDVPVVAIGGIDETNVRSVLEAGAKNICMVRYFMQTENLRQRIRTMKQIIAEYEG